MDKRTKVIIKAILSSGAAVLQFDPGALDSKVKSTAGDLVTTADLESEKVITQTIKTAYPGEAVISEEAHKGHELLTPEHLNELTGWIIDPIDGTNNFKRGMSYSGISIGYVREGVIILGAVYDPYRKELYIASKGRGATRNGEPAHVSNKSVFDAGTRICTSNSYEGGSSGGGTQANLDRFRKLGHVWVDVLGSAVLIMTDVASGRLDLYHHNGLKPWDNAAAFLIAEEAGAKITDLGGAPVTWLTSEIVMGNPALVDEFVLRTAV